MSPVPDEDREKPDSHSGDNEVENMEMPDLIIAHVETDSEEDGDADGGFQGYQPLPQDPDEDGNVQEDDDDDEGPDENDSSAQSSVSTVTGFPLGELYPNFPEGELPSYLQVPDAPRSDRKDLLWNQPRLANNPCMDQGHIAKIQAAMADFELPKSHIPAWAQNMTDAQWKEQMNTVKSKLPVSSLSTSGASSVICEAFGSTTTDSQTDLKETG